MKYLLLSTLLVWELVSCNSSKNIKEYYYPIDTMGSEGLVYEFQSLDSLPPYYWYYSMQERPDGKYLVATNYNTFYEIEQISIEKIVSNGTKLHQYTLYQKDSSGKATAVETSIKSNGYFPFEVKDTSGVFMYELKWTDPIDTNHHTTLVRNKHFEKDSVYAYNGKSVPCVIFRSKDLIDDDRNGHLEIRYSGREIYAQGLGLVYTEKNIQNRIIAYRLHSQFGMDKLAQKSKELYQNQ